MSNRTTVKSNIAGLNVPTVTNAIMGQMLVDNIADNVVFREDVSATQTSAVSNITVDFTDKDRIELTRTGGSLNITVNGVNDGEVKFLHITKTTAETLSFANVTDITPVKFRANVAASVVYRITKKLNQFVAEGLYETVLIADVDAYAGVVTPVTGLTGSDFDANNCPRVPIKSAVKAGDDAVRGEFAAADTIAIATAETNAKADVSTAYPFTPSQAGIVNFEIPGGVNQVTTFTITPGISTIGKAIIISFEIKETPSSVISLSHYTFDQFATTFKVNLTSSSSFTEDTDLHYIIFEPQTLVP